MTPSSMPQRKRLRFTRGRFAPVVARWRSGRVWHEGALGVNAIRYGRLSELEGRDMTEGIEPVYWFCNSCGEEVEPEDECCSDGEIEPSWDDDQA